MIWHEHTVGPGYTQGHFGLKINQVQHIFFSYVTYVEGNIEILTVV